MVARVVAQVEGGVTVNRLLWDGPLTDWAGAGTLVELESAPADRPRDPSEVNRESTRTKAEQSIDGLRQIANSTGTLSTLQLSNAVRLLARVALHLVRISLDKHEQED